MNGFLGAYEPPNYAGLLGNADPDKMAAIRAAMIHAGMVGLQGGDIGRMAATGAGAYFQNIDGQKSRALAEREFNAKMHGHELENQSKQYGMVKTQAEIAKLLDEQRRTGNVETMLTDASRGEDFTGPAPMQNEVDAWNAMNKATAMQKLSDPRFQARMMANGGSMDALSKLLEANRPQSVQPGWQRSPDGAMNYLPDPTKGITIDGSGQVSNLAGYNEAMAAQKGAETQALEGAKNAAERYMMPFRAQQAGNVAGAEAKARLPAQQAMEKYKDSLGIMQMPDKDGIPQYYTNPQARAALGGDVAPTGFDPSTLPPPQTPQQMEAMVGFLDSMGFNRGNGYSVTLQQGKPPMVARAQAGGQSQNIGRAGRSIPAEVQAAEIEEKKKLAIFDADTFITAQTNATKLRAFEPKASRLIADIDAGKLTTNSFAPFREQVLGALGSIGALSDAQKQQLNTLQGARMALADQFFSAPRPEGFTTQVSNLDLKFLRSKDAQLTDYTQSVKMMLQYKLAESDQAKKFAEHMRKARSENKLSTAVQSWEEGEGSRSIWESKHLYKYLPSVQANGKTVYKLPDGRGFAP